MRFAARFAWSRSFCQLALVLLLLFPALLRAEEPGLTWIGRIIIPNDLRFAKSTVGGLSGLSRDPASGTFWAISDDSAYKGGPPRAYQLRIAFDAEHVGAVTFLRCQPLRDTAGRLFPVADCEGIACTGKGGFWVSSEGRAGKKGALPWLRLFDLKTGRTLRDLALPAPYFPANAGGKRVPIGDATQTAGVASNKSLESCALSPDLRTVFIANEASLVQDRLPDEGDDAASLFNRTSTRISALNARTGECLAQKLYLADGGCFYGSVSELIALDSTGRLLVLERRVIRPYEGPGSCGIRIYAVDLRQAEATDLRTIPEIHGQKMVPLAKKLLFDSNGSGLEDVDNLEGICLAPLPGGGQALLAISDNNFNPKQQTQIHVFRYQP